MIRLIYRHYCDRCHTVIEVQEYELHRHVEIPRPTRHVVAGLDLCEPCEHVIQAALRKALVL